MHHITVIVLIWLLAGCGVPPTNTEHLAAQQPPSTHTTAPTHTIAPTATIVPSATAIPTSAVVPSPTVAPTMTSLPTSTPLPAAQGTGAIVHGTITYPADPALPDAAVLSVKVMPGTRTFFYPDMSEPLGEQRISPVRPGVVPFAIEYDPDAIDPLLPYTLVAQLDASGKRYFMGGAEVITNNQPSKVNIQLHPHPTATAVTGIVTYPSDRPLPPDSLLTIRLQTPVDGVGGPHVLGE